MFGMMIGVIVYYKGLSTFFASSKIFCKLLCISSFSRLQNILSEEEWIALISGEITTEDTNGKIADTVDETEEIRTKDGFSGHRIDGVYREDDNTKIGFAFFMRSSTNTSRVYRINYFGKKELEKTAKIRQVFDQIVASLEFNIL